MPLPLKARNPNYTITPLQVPALTHFFALSLENTKADKLGILYILGCPVSMHGMLSITHLGLVMMNGFN